MSLLSLLMLLSYTEMGDVRLASCQVRLPLYFNLDQFASASASPATASAAAVRNIPI